MFILGLLVGLSVLSARVAAVLYGEPFTFSAASDYVDLKVAFAWIGFAGAALLLSWRVDINAFSTHLLYRNRLVRCYLGASVPGRQEQPFTGFSAEDDLPLSSLQIPLTSSESELKARPVVLLNASVNVTRGNELGLQTRKARSFVCIHSSSFRVHPAIAGKARAGKPVFGDGTSGRREAGHRERIKFGDGNGDLRCRGQSQHGLLF